MTLGNKMKIKTLIAFLFVFVFGIFLGYKFTERQFLITSIELNKERIKIFNSIKENFGECSYDDENLKVIKSINLFKDMEFYIIEEENIKTIRCAK